MSAVVISAQAVQVFSPNVQAAKKYAEWLTNAFQLALSFALIRAQSISITVFLLTLKILISLFIPQALFTTVMCL